MVKVEKLLPRRILMKLRGKFYKMSIRLAMVHCSKCWQLRNMLKKLSVAEMKILRWMN